MQDSFVVPMYFSIYGSLEPLKRRSKCLTPMSHQQMLYWIELQITMSQFLLCSCECLHACAYIYMHECMLIFHMLLCKQSSVYADIHRWPISCFSLSKTCEIQKFFIINIQVGLATGRVTIHKILLQITLYLPHVVMDKQI